MDAQDRDRDVIPPLAGSGIYKIVVKAEDVVAKTTAQIEVPFRCAAAKSSRATH